MSGREFSDTEWKEEAKKQQNFFYHSYENQMFQAYNPQEDRLLLRAKVNFSSFGKPQKEAERIEDAYYDQQNSASEPIVEHIYETYDKICGSGKELCVSILFILCYKNKNIFRQPLYAVKGDGDTVHYIDTMGRRYKSWTDFKNCNRWKEMDICIPLNGYYSCSTDGFQYDQKSDVQLEFTITPAKRGSHKLVDIADGTAAVVGLGAGVIGIASLLTPVGWGVGAVAAYASIGGMGAASYGFVRSSYQIIDKALHDGDMLSLDSFVLYGTLALTPLNFASSFATGRLAQHAASGSIGSKGLRTIVTILNVTTLTLDGTMIVFNVANLVEKYKKDELTALDVVQFSMSVFFFTHTLIQPTTATQVIKQTQTERFETYSQNLSEGDARATFKRFVENNGGDIRKDSHTIRTINRMDNPDSFFKSNKDATIKLGGRKGKTVLVTDSNGVTNRINPNRVFQTEGYKPFVLVSQDRRRIESALGEDIESFEVDSNKIFQNASEHELRNLKETINSKNASPEIVNAAKELCQDLKEHTSGGFISMVEIVAAHVKEGNTTELLSDLLGPGRADFLAGLKADITEATRLANNAELSFKSALQAVYHFRKHGEDFLCKIPTIECYLNITPEMYKDAHLIRIHNMQDGRYRKTYLKPNDTLMVVDETRGGASLVTIFNKSGGWLKYLKELANNASIPDNTTLWDFIIGQFKLFKVTPRFFVFNDQQASNHSDDTLDDCFVDFLKSMSVDDVDFN